LLEKYWEGDTSIDEERLLKAYFASNEVDDSLRQFAPLFQVFREEQAVQFQQKTALAALKPQQYNWKPWAVAASLALLLTAGWWWAAQPGPADTYVAQPTDTPVQSAPDQQPAMSEKPQKVTPSAPVLAAQPRKRNYSRPSSTTRLNEEEEQAMAEIKAALALVSSKISKGRREAAKGASHLENVDRVFKKKKDSEG
jgi:hypothetical protein